MSGHILIEVRDDASNVRIASAAVDKVSNLPLSIRRVIGGIYFGNGSDGEHTLRASAPDYDERSETVEIEQFQVNQSIIRLKRSGN